MQAEEFEAHLETALVARPSIEQAKGVLVLALATSPDDAHAQLRRASEFHEVPMRALAAALVEVAAGRASEDPLLRKVVWQEWGLVPRS